MNRKRSTSERMYNGWTAIWASFIAVLFGILVIQFGQIFTFHRTDKKVLSKINKLNIEKQASDSTSIPLQTKYDLISLSIIEKNDTIIKLTDEIKNLKEQILIAKKNGEDVSEEINLLNRKEAELNDYLSKKGTQLKLIKDTILSYPEKLNKYKFDLSIKKRINDSLNSVLSGLNQKCN
jgi:chromosome segregation ATPase